MKKFLSFLLTFVMLFSLTMPAMAAEVEGGTEGNVTASYTPTITITGVEIREAALDPGAVEVDETNKTYTITIPADQTLVDVNIIASGQNLDKIPADNSNYLVLFLNYVWGIQASDYDPDTGNAVACITLETSDIGTSDLKYTTDGGTTWTDTGWDMVVKQAEAAPTEVSLNVKLNAIDSTEATITDVVSATLSGSVVNNRNIAEYGAIFTGDQTMTWNTIPTGYKIPEPVSLTITDTDNDGMGELVSNNIELATVELVDGVYVITVELKKDETTTPDTTPAEITGVSLSGTTGVTYDENTKTYTVAHDATNIVLTVTGTNFANLTSNYMVQFADGFVSILSDLVTGDTPNTVWTTVQADWFTDSNNFEIQYSTDGGSSWINMGIYVTYDAGTEEATAKITGATVFVNDVAQSKGNVIITAGDTVKVVFTGENFDKLTDDYMIDIAGIGSILSYFVTDSSNTATVSHDISELIYCNMGAITYTNAGETDTDTGYTLTYLEKGTDLTTIYFKNTAGWTAPCVHFRNSKDQVIGVAELKLVGGESDIYSAAVPESEWVYQVEFFDNATATRDNKQIIPTDGKNQYNYDTATWTTFTATVPTTTSANIVWGSMAFTYTDGENGAEGAWSNDGSAGAGTVTVTNNGCNTFTAQVAYTAEADYDEIEGSFDAASAELAAEASKTFTLTLKNQPEKAITAGTKIGTVTVTIEEYNPIYLNISFEKTVKESGYTIGHSKHTVRFYDANENLLSETAESSSSTETVAIPGGAVTFALYYKPYDHAQGELPIDRNWQTTAKTAVPTVDSNVSITFTYYHTTTVTVTAAQ